MNQGTQKTKIVLICGPTAVGKTTAGIETAKVFNGEIISADSRQIYRHMNIGTAKPTAEQLSEIPHYLIDFVKPDQHFDANQFAQMAHEIIANLVLKNKLPIVVGGTGFYIKALLHGLFRDNHSDHAVRQKLRQQADTHGKQFLFDKLRSVDPETANRLHPNDTFRVIRALEVYETSGEPLSSLHHKHRFTQSPYHALKIGLYLDRQTLYKHIDQRVDIMISEGLIEEVRAILDRGYSPELKAMKAIGYNHLAAYLFGNCSLEEAVRTLKRDTRRYAKRQMTWFRADPEINWIRPTEKKTLIKLVRQFLNTKK